MPRFARSYREMPEIYLTGEEWRRIEAGRVKPIGKRPGRGRPQGA